MSEVAVKEDNLKAFFAGNAIKSPVVEFVASKRFTGTDGTPLAWKIQPITKEENQEISTRCKKRRPIAGTRETEIVLDQERYAAELIAACVVFPDLNNEGLQESYGAVGAVNLLGKMLTAGEYTELFQAVLQANDFENGMDEKIKKAKN